MTMIGTLGWTPQDAMPLTLRELTVCYDAYVLDRWDHTASLSVLVFNLTALVSGLGGKSRIRPRSMYDFHPYRTAPRRGLRITTENFGVLRMIGNALAKR